MDYSLFPHSLSTENSKNSRRRKAVRNPLGTRMKRQCLDCVFCSPMHRCVESERERVPMDLLQPSAPCYSFCYSFYYPFCYSSLFFLLFFPLSFLLSFPLFPIIPHYLPLCQNEQAHRQTDRYERTFPNDLSHTQRAQLDRNKIVTVCSCVTRIVVDFYFRKFLPVYCNTITLTFYKIYT